jgi:hypothetical protein
MMKRTATTLLLLFIVLNLLGQDQWISFDGLSTSPTEPKVRLSNSTTQEVVSLAILPKINTTVLDLQNLNPGIYNATLFIEKSPIATCRIIKLPQ